MTRKPTPLLAAAVLLGGLTTAAVLLHPIQAVLAQDNAVSTPRPGRPLAKVLEDMGRGAGAVVLADSSIERVYVPAPAETATPETLEQSIRSILRYLPAGTTWAKLYVPTPKSGHWSGDDVAAYARAVARLSGRRVGAATPEGTIEILGRQLSEDEAQAHIRGLDLTLVYLVSNPNSVSPMGGSSQQIVDQFRGMDSAGRVKMLTDLEMQRMELMHALTDGMSDEEKIQFKRGMEAAMGGGKVFIKADKP